MTACCAQVGWPLSTVVDGWALGQYQLLLRHLLELELVQRALHAAWRVYQQARPLFRRAPALAPLSATYGGGRAAHPCTSSLVFDTSAQGLAAAGKQTHSTRPGTVPRHCSGPDHHWLRVEKVGACVAGTSPRSAACLHAACVKAMAFEKPALWRMQGGAAGAQDGLRAVPADDALLPQLPPLRHAGGPGARLADP